MVGSHRVVGRVGILIEMRRVTERAAFDALVDISRRRSRKPRGGAQRLVGTGKTRKSLR